MISGNYTNNNANAANIPYGAVKDVVPNNINQKLPENLQNLDAVEIANSNDAVAAAGKIDKKSALLTLPIYASFVALRSLNDTKKPFGFAGEYEKSFFGKLAKAGDFLSNGISKIIPDTIENGAKAKASSAKNWLIEHSSIIRSMTTPLKLENSTARKEANGIFARIMTDNADMFTKGFNGGAKEIGEIFGTHTEFWKRLQELGIEKATTSEGARAILAKALNEVGEVSIKDPKNKKYIEEIIENLSKSNKNIIIDTWRKGKKLPIKIGEIRILGKAMTLNVPMSEISNKMRAASGINPKTGAAAALGATTLGKVLPSAFSKIYEGLTSNVVGGKLVPIMQAYFLAKAAIAASKAPKGKKLATFMDEETGMVTFLFTMPLATSILKKAGGTKYIGLDKAVEGAATKKAAQSEGVSRLRDAFKALNEKIATGSISSGEYVEETKKIKNMLKGKVNGKGVVRFWQKPFKALGRILGSNYNKETIKPFIERTIPENAGSLSKLGISVANRASRFLYKMKSGKNLINNTPGGLLRFGLVMFVLSPLLSKPIKWVVNKIFGKPYDAEAEKKEQAKKAQEDAMKNNPFAKMTEQELFTLLNKNQAAMEKAQNDPKLMQELTSDPQKLYEFLQNGAQDYDKAQANAKPSSLLEQYKKNIQNGAASNIQPSANLQPNAQLNQNTGLNNNMNLSMPAPSVQRQGQPATKEPERSYIPSSAPADGVIQSQKAQDKKFNALLQDMDNTAKEYSKYLNV